MNSFHLREKIESNKKKSINYKNWKTQVGSIMSAHHLILIRHGQSEWNKKNIFTGWTDINLSEKGKKEALQAGLELKKKKLLFDFVFSSALKRAIHTTEIILEQMNLKTTPFVQAWQLNERHYGALQGQNRQDVINRYGEVQVYKWRRDFKTAPPPLKKNQILKKEKLYKSLKQIPNGESLKDTQKRVLPFWKQEIFPHIQNKKSVLIVAHGNSLRALVKYLENIPDHKISSLEIKTGKPLIYKIDETEQIISKEILDF